jgi:hypothetical protein
MNFTALPVNVGDSFLLNVDDNYILVDGGKNESHVIDLLDKENIPNNHINLLVCTHYDSDNINGIIGILKSDKYSFDEIWFPEITGSLSYSIAKNKYKYFLHDLRFEENLLTKKDVEDDLPIPYEENNDPQLDLINYSVLKNFVDNRNYFHLNWFGSQNIDLLENLYSACSLVKNSLSSGANVRWFKFKNDVVDTVCGFNMIAKNAIETGITSYSTPNIFFQALTLTRINKESLVFMYVNGSQPNVLFTADSDLTFSKKKIQLKDQSIVTSPHHGAEANKGAYKKILGNDLYFVRSDQSQIKRPCPEYTSQKNRYCTICRNKGPKQKVTLSYSQNVMTTSAKACSC